MDGMTMKRAEDAAPLLLVGDNEVSTKDLDLPVRVHNALRIPRPDGYSRCMEPREICQLSAAELLRRNNFGKASLKALQDALGRHGLALRGETVRRSPKPADQLTLADLEAIAARMERAARTIRDAVATIGARPL